MSDQTTYQIYSPASVVGSFNNALIIPQTLSLIYLKGRYTAGQGKSYAGYYYDLFYSESDTTSISVKLSGILRSKLVNGEVYILKGFIEKSVRNSSIDLRFAAEEIVQQEERQFSEEDLKRYDLIQAKLEKGSRDLETFIREKKLRNEPIKIANIYGHSAIVQHDFNEGLNISSGEFEITDFTCNITSATSIIQKLQELKPLQFDIIALVRGGGDRQSFDVFSDVDLANEFINLESITITALGHTVDESLLDKLADRRFHVPHDYGDGLHKIIEKLREEKSNSRAVLIEEVKKDVTKQFEEQVKTLTTQLGNKNREFTKLQDDSAKQIKDLTENTQKQLKAQSDEMAKYKTDIADLHAKNLKSAIQSETATLNARIESVSKENVRLQEELSKKKSSMLFYVVLLVIGIIIGFILTKL
ncbi:exodeoxyribonuclease VII large subunit [Kaistella sp.]|uniref:exodeoxyribonuclease VII large subunit n=1 Tax=Kaistella sp. TaxID=2782235 RepID=UPI002F933F70